MIEFPLLAPLVPPAICAGPHGQTLLGNTLPSRGPHADDQIDVSLPDGDRLTVLVHAGKRPVMVHLWHGLCGHAQSGYVLRATRWLTRAGYSVLRGNHRGCGAGRGKARLPYHSGRSGDLGHVVAFARKQWPDKKHIAVGFSLSGNALLLLVGRGGVAFPDAAISVNAPIDLALCSDRLLARENRLYDFRFARLCKRTVRERELDGLGAPPYKLPWNMTLQRFDDLYTAPAGGFADEAGLAEVDGDVLPPDPVDGNKSHVVVGAVAGVVFRDPGQRDFGAGGLRGPDGNDHALVGRKIVGEVFALDAIIGGHFLPAAAVEPLDGLV